MAGATVANAWPVLFDANAELANWLSFGELLRLGQLNRSFRSTFEHNLGFLWRSRGAACDDDAKGSAASRAERRRVARRAVRFGKTEHVRILMPMMLRAAAEPARFLKPFLFEAIKEGHVQVVRVLLELGGPELPMTTRGGESCLIVCVRYRRGALLGVLAEAAGAARRELFTMSTFSNFDYSNMNCLLFCVYRSDLQMLYALLRAAAEAEALPELLMLTTDSGETCLHLAVEYCLWPAGLDVVRALLAAAGPRRVELLTLRSDTLNSCWMSAASVGNVELLHLLLDAAGDAAQGLLMLCNIGGWSCVHASVKHWHGPMLRALLHAAGPRRHELLMLTSIAGRSCLHTAVDEGRVDAIGVLLEAVGDGAPELLMLCDAEGSSCLHRGAQQGNVAVVRALLEAAETAGVLAALLMRQCGAGQSCLHACARGGCVLVAKALLGAAGDGAPELLMLCDAEGSSCLHRSAHLGDALLTRGLLEAADEAGVLATLLMIAGPAGFTCLHSGANAIEGSLAVVQALLQAAGPRRLELLMPQTDHGFSALHFAASGGSLEVVEALLQAAGHRRIELLMQQTAHGFSALHFAARCVDVDIVLALLEAARPEQRALLTLTNTNDSTCMEISALIRNDAVTDALNKAYDAC